MFFFIITFLCAGAFATNFRHTGDITVKNKTQTVNKSDIKVLSREPGVENFDDSKKPNIFMEINIPATEMTIYENGEELFRRPVAIGSAVYPTPEHKAEIYVIEWNPWWFPPKSKWARGEHPTPPGPRNPLGPVKLRLGEYGEILLHGTNKTYTVGTPASHGCMRMFNQDARGLAWYLQSNFSQQSDPKYLEMYREKSRSTFRVKLDVPIPVKLIYDPIVVRGDKLVFYPDHYRKLKAGKKTAIISSLMRSGIDIQVIDEGKIDSLSKNWPAKKAEVPISDLLIDSQVDLLKAPECS